MSPDRPTRRPPGRQPTKRRPTPHIVLADPAWRRTLPGVARLAIRAALAGGGAGTVMLASDRAVRHLNRTHRGKDKPTNVLTFEPAPHGGDGDIVLAYGVVRREAQAARRPLAHHVAHLVLHGALHLRGADHHGAGEARRMEMAESRLLHRIGVPNPWRRA